MIILAGLILLAVTIIGGTFIIKKSRLDSWLSAAMTTKRAMQDELEHDGVAEDDPVIRDLAQAARDRGDV